MRIGTRDIGPAHPPYIIAELGAFRAETNKRLEHLERMARNERVRAEVPMKSPGGPLGSPARKE